MDPESQKLLQEAIELARDNNKVLHELRQAMRMGRIIKGVYWVVIIGSAVGAFYFIQPFLDGILGAYGGATDTIEQFRNINQ